MEKSTLYLAGVLFSPDGSDHRVFVECLTRNWTIDHAWREVEARRGGEGRTFDQMLWAIVESQWRTDRDGPFDQWKKGKVSYLQVLPDAV